ncbi:amidase [Conexibacter arvalis]|uniref:Asp-tRNA(Asn)/Glu-tRNA(Gln) amidotransferase A subunit family amidase n=1 Tax=Conexibacter arvalis TaxID=912552 RepID=A0A840I9B8_9ACTN|nr:amidase [Conexibacter arvalis]MBB4660698.1 Asp-tRNA(Asn)/Glu-tRNA(Gln) amidotransferase A subunit family amidase [Conexibacter arvalis]
MASANPQLDEVTIAGLHRGYRDGSLTATAVVREYLSRIERLDRGGPRLNSILAVDAAAEETAAALDRALAERGELSGPLHGVPVVVKDNILAAGMPTTFGSIALDGYRSERDATVVARLRAAGAIVLAKTTLPDWASSWFSYSSQSETTRNPFDPDHDPGGSSSGSGAAISANLATAGLGTDCGGSVRLPASFCGLVGVRTTPGVVPRTGSSWLVKQQDTIGPMTRTVEDAARLLDVLVGWDPGDPYSAAATIGARDRGYLAAVGDRSLVGVRLGLLVDAFGDDGDPARAAVNAVVRAAVDQVVAAGAEIVEVSIPNLMDHIVKTSMYGDRSKHDLDATLRGLGDAPVASMAEIHAAGRYDRRLDLFDNLMDGPDDPEASPEYLARFAARHAFTLAVEQALAGDRLDALLFPTSQLPAPSMEERGDWTTLTFPTNTLIASQTWTPAVTVPGGFTDAGLPVGVELVGRRFDELRVMRVAGAVEAATRARRAPVLGGC